MLLPTTATTIPRRFHGVVRWGRMWQQRSTAGIRPVDWTRLSYETDKSGIHSSLPQTFSANTILSNAEIMRHARLRIYTRLRTGTAICVVLNIPTTCLRKRECAGQSPMLPVVAHARRALCWIRSGRNMHLMWCFRMTEIQVRECPKSPSTAIHAYKTRSAQAYVRALYM